MSGTFPASPAARWVDIESFEPSLVSVAHSLATQRRTRGNQRWRLKLQFAAMTRAQWAPIFAFLVAQRGRYETFQYVLPSPQKTPQGTATGTPTVNNAAGSPVEAQTGSRSIATAGWTAGVTGILKAGDYIKFAGHTKVYMVTADANSDGSGYATLSIAPGLAYAEAHGAAITVSSVPFTVALTEDTVRSGQRLGPVFEPGVVELVEAWP